MNKQMKKPKIKLMIKFDYTCGWSFLGLIMSMCVILGITLGLILLGYDFIQFTKLIIGFLVMFVLCLLILIIRVSIIQKIFNYNCIVLAKVTNTNYVRGCDQIYFTYQYMNKEYKKMNVVSINDLSKRIFVGESIDVCISPKKPKRALIYSLYV